MNRYENRSGSNGRSDRRNARKGSFSNDIIRADAEGNLVKVNTAQKRNKNNSKKKFGDLNSNSVGMNSMSSEDNPYSYLGGGRDFDPSKKRTRGKQQTTRKLTGRSKGNDSNRFNKFKNAPARKFKSQVNDIYRPVNSVMMGTPRHNAQNKAAAKDTGNITIKKEEKLSKKNNSFEMMSKSSPVKKAPPYSKDKLRLSTLSGTNEVGRNSNFIEFGDDILMIDCGFSFPGQELLGVDYTIPNLTYLKKNKHKIKGILITHGHLDHTGGLPYVLPELDFPPIYAGKFANALIKARLSEFGLENKVQFTDVDREHSHKFQLGGFSVDFIGVTHSIPNSFSIFVECAKGNVLFSGDYKIDQSPANEPESDYAALKALQGRVDLALMESTNSRVSGKARSETEIAANIEDILRDAKGRVVVASFASMVSRLFSVIKIAQKLNRKVFVFGKSLRAALAIARDQRYIDIPDNLIVDDSKINQFPDDQILVICTGSQGERYAALNLISLGDHKTFKVKPGDLILMSSSEIPTNVTVIEKMTDRLIAAGADILQNDTVDIHESGHALQEDMKIMYELTQPKVVIPVHGSLTMRYKNKKNYVNWGMKPENVYLTHDGAIWEYDGTSWDKSGEVESEPILIDGLGVGDIGDVVLKDREQLSEYGMVVVVLNMHSKTHRLISNPKFISRGFVYVKTSKQLFDAMEMMVKDIHRDWMQNSSRKSRYDQKDLRHEIEKALSKYIYSKTEREPIILPVFI